MSLKPFALLAILVAVLSASCQADTNSGTPESDGVSNESGPTGNAASIVDTEYFQANAGDVENRADYVPFYEYLIAASDQQRAIHTQREAIVVKCMSRKGFTYTPRDFVENDGSEVSSALTPNQIEERARTAAEGVINKATGKAPAGDSDEGYPAAYFKDKTSMSASQFEEYEKALTLDEDGKPGGGGKTLSADENYKQYILGGCHGEAVEAIYGDRVEDAKWIQWVEDTSNSVLGPASEDPAMYATDQKVKECFRTKGYGDDSITDLVDKLKPDHSNAQELLQEEIKISLAKSDCLKQEGQGQMYLDLILAYEKKFFAEKESELLAYREYQKKAAGMM